MSDAVSEHAVLLTPTRAGMPDNPTPAEEHAAGAHFMYCQQLQAQGVLSFAGRTLDAPFMGLIVLRVADRAEAERLISADPGVQAGLFDVQIQPFRTALST